MVSQRPSAVCCAATRDIHYRAGNGRIVGGKKPAVSRIASDAVMRSRACKYDDVPARELAAEYVQSSVVVKQMCARSASN